MRTLLMILAVVAAGAAGGCQDQQSYDIEIANAREALVIGFPELAEHHLKNAEAIAVDSHVPEASAAALLRAEMKLRQGQTEAARTLAQRALDQAAHGTVQRAQAQEVLAKVEIRCGQFDVARDRLVEAERLYTLQSDRQRVRDLLHLVRGLLAYGQGQVQLARGHWKQIQDEQLKVQVTTRPRTTETVIVLR